MELLPLSQSLIVSAFAALLVGLGWLISSQISTNKSMSKAITDAVMEFKVAMTMIEERSNTQKTLCQQYRDSIYYRHKELDIKVEKFIEQVQAQTQNH